MKTAETILKEKLDNIKLHNNADWTFNKIIEAMQEHTQQHLKALAEDIKENAEYIELERGSVVQLIDKTSIDEITNKHISELCKIEKN